MSSKNSILSALKQSALTAHPMPVIDIEVTPQPLVDTFAASLATVAGELHQQGGLAALQAKVDELMAQGLQVLSLVEGVSGNRQVPNTAHELADIDYAILAGELGVAENGAIWVSQTQHRVTPFICENLILALPEKALVANMHQAVNQVSLAQGELGVFVAGPSKTADIEQALVVGAHGACSLQVYLY